MHIRGYYLEALYPRFKVYRIILIDTGYVVSSYQVSVNIGSKIESEYPGYTDLGGIIS